jgi:hypothetical protein
MGPDETGATRSPQRVAGPIKDYEVWLHVLAYAGVAEGHRNSIDDSIDRWLPATDPAYGNAHQRESQQCDQGATDDWRKEVKKMSHQRCDQNTQRAGDQERP